MTLLEVLVVIVVAIVMMLVLEPDLFFARHSRAPRIQCVNNLRQTGLAFRIWEGDNTNLYPMAVSITNGGSMEFTTGPNAFRHFQVMSNELSTPKVVLCPADNDRTIYATNFTYFNNSNISYFVGIVPNDTNPMAILAGDHNITNGMRIGNGILELTTNSLAGWTADVHKKVGNVALADGSVQQLTIAGLRACIANTGLPTNWLEMPVLGP